MSEPARNEELQQLLEVARVMEPRALDALSARRAVRVAIARADRPPRRSALQLRWWIPALVAAGLVLALLRPRPTAIELADDALPLRLSLKTGDALVIAAATRLRVLDDAAPLRKVAVERGSVLFDVAKVGAGQAFEVHTSAARVRVVGTIFTVEVAGEQTIVRVHEGQVRVGSALLSADEVWSSAGEAAPGAGPFAAEARALVQARRTQTTNSARPEARPHVQAARVSPLESSAASTSSVPAPSAARSTTEELEPSAPSSNASRSTTNDASAKARASRRDVSGEPLPEALARDAREAETNARRERARAKLRAGDAAGALRIAVVDPDDDALALLAADALRALDRYPEAIARYEQLAARTEHELTRSHAGFAAAQLALHKQGDAESALTIVSRFALREPQAPLRERASALSVDALLALGRVAEAREEARSYLAREPETKTSARMRALLE